MSDKVLFYKNIVPLNGQQHKNYYFEQKGDYSFAEEGNALFLLQGEFTKASHEYPIVFAGKDDELAPFAIVGLKNFQNLFINQDNGWDAGYIPAYVRRYPFVLAKNEKNFTVCIDDTCKGLNQEGAGERLFDEEGQKTTYLANMMNFLNQFQVDQTRTLSFVAKLREYDLLEPMHANLELKTGERLALGDFFVVSRDKLKALDANKTAELIKSDDMESIYAHIISLGNFNSLMEKFAKLKLAS